MSYYKNLCLENIVAEVDGITYTEEWKDIPDYEGYYVSTFGRVKSLSRMIILKQQVTEKGYLTLSIYKNGQKKTFRSHQLVGSCFVYGRTDIAKEINHKDLDKKNNFYRNLEWANRYENMSHAHRNIDFNMPFSLDHGHSRVVLHPEYGIFFTVREAAFISSKNESNMCAELRGRRKGATKFKYA